MKFNVKDEAPSLSILAAMWLVALWAWPRAADRIAIHFNVEGKANGFGGKLEGLLLLPAMATVVYIASMLRSEHRRSDGGLVLMPRLWMHETPRIGALGLMCAIHMFVTSRAVGWTIATDIVAIAAGVFVIALGNYLPKTQPNEFIGVRTPWTYRSDLSWYRTHRLAGQLLILCGLATIVTAVVRPSAAMPMMVGTVIAAGLVSVVYSYVVWRSDGARHDGQKPQSILR